MRLIDADALLSAIDEYMGNAYDCPLNEVAEFQSSSNDTKVIYAVEGLYEATEIIDEQPTVDVVRCKECKHWKPSGAEAGNLFENMEPIGGCIYAKFFRKASEFCSRSERRNDG